jgi:hypothetical protein
MLRNEATLMRKQYDAKATIRASNKIRMLYNAPSILAEMLRSSALQMQKFICASNKLRMLYNAPSILAEILRSSA